MTTVGSSLKRPTVSRAGLAQVNSGWPWHTEAPVEAAALSYHRLGRGYKQNDHVSKRGLIHAKPLIAAGAIAEAALARVRVSA
jgi:hypothetical protein